MYCNVLVTQPFDNTFTYKIPSNQIVKPGNIVKVPFGKKKDQIGVVYELCDNNEIRNKSFTIKEILHVYNNIILNDNIFHFIEWIAEYTLASKGLVLKLFLINAKIVDYTIEKKRKFLFKKNIVVLNKDQKKALKIINESILNKPSTIVLEGVTGSGKTEVYFEVIRKQLLKKKQILIMVPEISLTPQLEVRFKERFGFSADIWHSKISEKKRKELWHRCYYGEPIIVIGARSSLFLPFNNLGLIVVDEEHDLSFKQEDSIRYQARDLAIVRSKIEKFSIILSSATPSLETQNNIQRKKFYHVYLPSQFSGLDLPTIKLVDLKKEKLEKNKWISSHILKEIKTCVEKNEQVLLFLNRRGYSPLSICNNCGNRYQCNHCSAWLVMHRNKNRMLCHHCGTIYPVSNICVKCNSQNSIKLIGPGVERLEEEIKERFPNYKTKIMSSDNANTPKKIKKIIDDFSSKKINILVATQIMAKGYHFPNLSLVGVIDADTGLLGGDIRAIEKTFNLLQQVSGRAGRSKKVGKVIIQTYFPDQSIIQSLQKRDRKKFVVQSLLERKKFNVPPFSFLTSIIVSSSSKIKAETYANKLTQALKPTNKIDILGPVESPIFLLRGNYRYRLLLKGASRRTLNDFTRKLFKNCPTPSNIRAIIDVDPYTFI